MRIDFRDSTQLIVAKLIDNIVLPPCRLLCFLLCILLSIWLPFFVILSSALVLAFAGLEFGECLMNWIWNQSDNPNRVWVSVIAAITGLSGIIFKETKITKYIMKIIAYHMEELFRKIWNNIKSEARRKKCAKCKDADTKGKSEPSSTGK